MPRKRATNGNGHIRQRPDGRWEGQISLPPDPGTGKQKRKSIYGASEAEVAKKMRQIATQLDEGTYKEPSKLTVGQWLDIWHKEYLGNVKPLTVNQYDVIIRNQIKPHLGAVKLVSLTPHLIQSTYNKLQKGEGKQKALSAKTIRNVNGVLHSALEKALRLNYIPTNPTASCTLPRVVKKEMRAIMDNDIKLFMDAVKGHMYENVLLVDMYSGMRRAEILALTWDCVDFNNGIITVNKQLQKDKQKGGIFVFAPLKNNRQRRIPVSNYVLDVLRNQKRRQTEWRLRAGAAWGNEKNLVFTNEIGQNLVGNTVYSNFKKIVSSIGLDEVRFHDLRHTFALLSLQNGDDIKTVQQSLGHATAAFTLDVYGHVSEKMQRESAARMDAFINAITVKKS